MGQEALGLCEVCGGLIFDVDALTGFPPEKKNNNEVRKKKNKTKGKEGRIAIFLSAMLIIRLSEMQRLIVFN